MFSMESMMRGAYRTTLIAISFLHPVAVLAADVVVLESSAPEIAVGAVVAEDRSVTIPAGRSVTVIMPDGETRIVQGFYQGPLGAARGRATDAASALTGARGGDTRVLGAVRAPDWEASD
jgi:hypothetical protein